MLREMENTGKKFVHSVQCYDISFCFLLDSTSSTILLVLMNKTAVISHGINLEFCYLWIVEYYSKLFNSISHLSFYEKIPVIK